MFRFLQLLFCSCQTHYFQEISMVAKTVVDVLLTRVNVSMKLLPASSTFHQSAIQMKYKRKEFFQIFSTAAAASIFFSCTVTKIHVFVKEAVVCNILARRYQITIKGDILATENYRLPRVSCFTCVIPFTFVLQFDLLRAINSIQLL